MLEGCELRLNCDYLENRAELNSLAENIIYTGSIDAYFNYKLGALEYRTIKFEHETLSHTDNFQGHSVINYTDKDTPYTRIIEHKHFYPGLETSSTVITREYSSEWNIGQECYYPVNDVKNNSLYEQYSRLADLELERHKIIFGGRLGEYKYYDMNIIIERALELAENLL